MKNKAFIAIAALVVGILATFVGATPVTEASGNCNISSFYASPQNVIAGGSTTLFATSSNCQNLTLSGGTYSNYQFGYNTSLLVGPLYSSTFYTLTGTDQYGIQTTATTTVTVGGSGTGGSCVINSFYANPTALASGASSDLYWATSGCSTVTVTGPGVNSNLYSGSISTGPVYGTSQYNITAYSYGGNTVNQSTTLYAGGGTQYGSSTPTTTAATNISGTTATLNGYMNINNGTYCNGSPYTSYCSGTTYYFLYGTSQYSLNQQTTSQITPPGSGTGNLSAQVYNLIPNTTYYFELVTSTNSVINYGNTLSFYSSGYNNNYPYPNPYPYPTPVVTVPVTAVTSIATEITGSTAQLNGLVTGGQGTPVTAYFEYGTSPSFGSQTNSQNVVSYSVNNYYDTISVSPNTTYYFRIDGVSNGQIYPGATATFTTPGTNYYVPPVTYVTPHTTFGTGNGGGSAFVSLSITDGSQSVFPGNSISYLVNYQNVSNSTLSGAIMNVVLPSTVAFQSASQGVLTTNNTVAITLGTLQPGATGMISINVTPNAVVTPGTTLVATATIGFTTPSRAQDAAIAYAINNIGSPVNNNNLAGLAFYGNGFYPNTLLGWILLIGILVVIVLMMRYFYARGNKEALRAQPETHIHYSTPPPTQPITDKYGDPMYH